MSPSLQKRREKKAVLTVLVNKNNFIQYSPNWTYICSSYINICVKKLKQVNAPTCSPGKFNKHAFYMQKSICKSLTQAGHGWHT